MERGIKDTQKRRGESEARWKIPLLMFKLFLSSKPFSWIIIIIIITIIISLLFWEFCISMWTDGFSTGVWVTTILLNILANPNYALVMDGLPLIFKSSSSCISPLVTVPSAPISINITVNFMFHSFFFSVL